MGNAVPFIILIEIVQRNDYFFVINQLTDCMAGQSQQHDSDICTPRIKTRDNPSMGGTSK